MLNVDPPTTVYGIYDFNNHEWVTAGYRLGIYKGDPPALFTDERNVKTQRTRLQNYYNNRELGRQRDLRVVEVHFSI